jgi:flagellar biogenesis protein FliO
VYGKEHEVMSESVEVTVSKPEFTFTSILGMVTVITIIFIMAVFLKKRVKKDD